MLYVHLSLTRFYLYVNNHHLWSVLIYKNKLVWVMSIGKHQQNLLSRQNYWKASKMPTTDILHAHCILTLLHTSGSALGVCFLAWDMRLWAKWVSLKRKKKGLFLSSISRWKTYSLSAWRLLCLAFGVLQYLAPGTVCVWWKTPICVCVYEIVCLQECMFSLCQEQLFFSTLYSTVKRKKGLKYPPFFSHTSLIAVFVFDCKREV